MTDLKIRILHVEDNPDDQLILKRSLTERMPIDYDLITADSGTKGLNTVEKENFDLLLLDYRLPDMTGIEFVQETKKKTSKHRSFCSRAKEAKTLQ